MIWIWLQYNIRGIFNHNNLGCSGARVYQLTCSQIVKCLSNFISHIKTYNLVSNLSQILASCDNIAIYGVEGSCDLWILQSRNIPIINSVVQITLLALSSWKFMSTLHLIEQSLAKFKVSSLESTSITSGSSVIVLCREEKINTLFDIHRLSTNLRVVHWKLIRLKYD